MEKVHRGVAAGSVVQARGEQWRVVHARRFGVYTFVTLDGQGSRPRPRITLLSPFDTLVAAAPMSLRRAGPGLAAKTTMAALSRSRPGRRLWAALDASFDVLPWQLAPALAVLNGATRVLLADAVGLGKTVQAGLILAELSRRGLLERALVLTPPALREAWAGELRKRFNLEAAVIDQPALLAQQRLGAVGANPWARVPVVVSSIDLVKRADIRAAVEEQAIDVLVVDEAHHATPGSDRGAVVARLAAQVHGWCSHPPPLIAAIRALTAGSSIAAGRGTRASRRWRCSGARTTMQGSRRPGPLTCCPWPPQRRSGSCTMRYSITDACCGGGPLAPTPASSWWRSLSLGGRHRVRPPRSTP
jgi:hypothetical protein